MQNPGKCVFLNLRIWFFCTLKCDNHWSKEITESRLTDSKSAVSGVSAEARAKNNGKRAFVLTGGTPSLKLLWLSQEPGVQARRLDTLLACFDLSSSREELQAVGSPFEALCCLLIYLFVQVTPPWLSLPRPRPQPLPLSGCRALGVAQRLFHRHQAFGAHDSSEGSAGAHSRSPFCCRTQRWALHPRRRGPRHQGAAGALWHVAHVCQAFWMGVFSCPCLAGCCWRWLSCHGEKVQHCSLADLAGGPAVPR